jgi:hypothetical protein
MAHPRRSRAERILAVGAHKDGLFVVRIRILCPDAPQTQGHPSRGGAIGGVGARSLVRDPCELAIFADYLGNGERTPNAHPTGMIPVPCFIGVAASFRAGDQ